MGIRNFSIDVEEPDALFEIQPSSFDVITMWHVLEHIHRLHDYLHKIYECLDSGGKFIVAVPNYESEDARHYGTLWAGYDVPRHLYHFSINSMSTLLSDHNFIIKGIKPMLFDPYYVSLLSEKYLTGSANFLKAFYRGTYTNLKSLNDTQKSDSLIYIAEKGR
jgi:2-polyprenyl-3-methyl-5-hydroxy-6-metoxy-1,4-benzoquinol methylase